MEQQTTFDFMKDVNPEPEMAVKDDLGFCREGFSKFFSNAGDMLSFLREVEQNDRWYRKRAAECQYDEENEVFPVSPSRSYPVFRQALPSMEERSLDTARGHKFMTTHEVLHSMNNYFGKMPCPKLPGKILVRGGHVLAFNSGKYTIYGQGEVFESLLNNIEQYDPTFVSGQYVHENTEATFVLEGVMNNAYMAAWKKAGYRDDIPTSVVLKFNVNDVAESSIQVATFLSVNGTMMLLGEPLSRPHLGQKVIDPVDFVDVLGKTVEDELDQFTTLLKTRVYSPAKAVRKAARKIGLEKLSKKGCNELFQNEPFEKSETAYMLYMYLHGIFDTDAVKKAPKETKNRLYIALHRLAFEDWTEFDR